MSLKMRKWKRKKSNDNLHVEGQDILGGISRPILVHCYTIRQKFYPRSPGRQ